MVSWGQAIIQIGIVGRKCSRNVEYINNIGQEKMMRGGR